MARTRKTTPTYTTAPGGASLPTLTKELWQAAVNLRGSIEPADYKRYVLPLIFLRFLSLRYERRRGELEGLIREPGSDYYADTAALDDPDEYRSTGAFVIPEEARWENIRAAAQADDIKIRLDNILRLLEDRFPDDLRGLLPPVYAGSNLDRENVAGLINLFSKDAFSGKYGGEDLLGRVYEYFIGEFASSEGKRGGEYFTPRSIVQLLVAMLEPESGKVFDPCCGSGGMFVQSDLFTHHSGNLSFYGQESKDFTYRLCRMNLFIHGIRGDIQLGNSYSDDKHADLRADFILANPPFNDGAKGENGWGADKIPDKDPRWRSAASRCRSRPATPTRCGSCTSSTTWPRGHGRLRDGDRRAEQQRDRPPPGAPGAGGARRRGLHRAAHRPTVRQHADPLHALVSLQEPRRGPRFPPAAGRDPVH